MEEDWPTVADLVDTGVWYRNRGILLVNFTVLLALLTSYCNGFDSSMTGGLQLIEQWQQYFGYPKGSTLGLMTSVQNIGAFLALPIAPIVSDQLGRRTGIFAGGLLALGGVVLQCQSVNITQFILSRGLLGFGLCISINAAPLLITELAYPSQRGPITAGYNTAWYAGSIVSAWVTFGTYRMTGNTWAWRIPSVLQALPPLLQCSLIWLCPESPRWLISRGHDEEAKRVLGKYHGNGNLEHPLVEFEFKEIKEAIDIEREVGTVSWWALIATPGNRRRTHIIVALAIFSQWSGNGLVSYYINLILESVGFTDPGTKTLINGCLQIFNLLMALSGAFYIDRIGRRKLFLISNFGMLLAFSLWTVTTALFDHSNSKGSAYATIAMVFVFFGFYDIAYTPLLIAYTLEILPFKIRAKGFACMSFTVSLALIFNQYVNPVAIEKLHWKYYIFYIAFLAFEIVFVSVYLLETKGRTLEQTAVLFDGTRSKESLVLDQFSFPDMEQRPPPPTFPPEAIVVSRPHAAQETFQTLENGATCTHYEYSSPVQPMGRTRTRERPRSFS